MKVYNGIFQKKIENSVVRNHEEYDKTIIF